mmetsp:Transcript_141270/g.246331  ORF Transcript_141270/g.246331 Transcript_141270/m.246331 type:complete len:324 (-) Transcript_141270:119-1090(-)
MEHRNVILYLSIVLNLVLSIIMSLGERSSQVMVPQRAEAKRAAESVVCPPCNCPADSRFQDPSPVSHVSEIEGGADPAFLKDPNEAPEAPVTFVKVGPNPFDFMSQQCGQRPVQPGLYFVDLGANCGNSYMLFVRRILPGLNFPSKSKVMRAFLFEFNPRIIHKFLLSLEKQDPRVKLMPAAAHVEDGHFTAYLDSRKERPGEFPCIAKPGSRNPSGASSLLAAMPRAGAPINVTTVSIPAWLKRTFCKGDVIHLKMDIEGFEYPLLGAMIESKVHCMVDTFYIEFHFMLPYTMFMGRNMTTRQAAAQARALLRECTVVKEWF